MITGYLGRGDTDLYYQTDGEGPALLFIHAAVADSRMWRRQMGLPGHKTIAFDQRGFGRTEWAPGTFANRLDALAVLDDLEVDRAVVVGCSNGGEAAMQLALVAPHRVRGLVLVGAAPRGWEPEGGWADDPLWEESVAATEARDFERAVELDARLWLAGPNRSLDDIDPELVELFRAMDRIPQSTEAERVEFIETLEPPTNERLDEIDTPSLVIVGEHDHPDLSTAAVYLSDRLGAADPIVLRETAHLPSLEVPDVFNAELSAFLDAI